MNRSTIGWRTVSPERVQPPTEPQFHGAGVVGDSSVLIRPRVLGPMPRHIPDAIAVSGQSGADQHCLLASVNARRLGVLDPAFSHRRRPSSPRASLCDRRRAIRPPLWLIRA
jgi:hypothetical protein